MSLSSPRFSVRRTRPDDTATMRALPSRLAVTRRRPFGLTPPYPIPPGGWIRRSSPAGALASAACSAPSVRSDRSSRRASTPRRSARLSWSTGRVSGLRREPRQFRGPGLVAGLAALDDRQGPGGDRHHQEHGGRDEERAQPTSAAFGGAQLGIVGGAGRVEEFPLEEVGFTRVGDRPVECGSEPGTAVELGRLSPRCLPAGGARREVMVETPALAIVLQPGAGTRPLTEQRLVGDLDAVGPRGDESPVRERGEHCVGVAIVRCHELGEGERGGVRRRRLRSARRDATRSVGKPTARRC